jgi:hypothetical protein
VAAAAAAIAGVRGFIGLEMAGTRATSSVSAPCDDDAPTPPSAEILRCDPYTAEGRIS